MTFRPDALAGQHLVISGGAGALGIGIIKKLTDHGAVITVNDLIEDAEARSRLEEAGIDLEKTHYLAGDLTSKAGMNQMMRGFARELAAEGIRANAIAPGIVDAGMAKKQWETVPEYRARAQKAIPLGFLQPVETVADAFLFLCSPAASYMTGSVMFVDGGCNLYPMD